MESARWCVADSVRRGACASRSRCATGSVRRVVVALVRHGLDVSRSHCAAKRRPAQVRVQFIALDGVER
eukprot:7052819-Pyramimonas_sp.AAC.1